MSDFTSAELFEEIRRLHDELEYERAHRQALSQTLHEEREASPYRKREGSAGRQLDSADIEQDREKTNAQRKVEFGELLARKEEEALARPRDPLTGAPTTGPGTPWA